MNPTATAIYALAILVCVPACSTPERTTRQISSHVFGDQTAFDAFRTASDVTAERLNCKTSGICISRKLADYRRYSRRSLSQAQVAQLRDLFSQRASYPDGLRRLKGGEAVIKLCGTRYGVLLTFHAKPIVRIALCFQCDEFGVYVGEGEDSPFQNRDTDFGPMRSALVPLMKSIYPNDSEIQSLPLKRY
jgi:hypothetical protein